MSAPHFEPNTENWHYLERIYYEEFNLIQDIYINIRKDGKIGKTYFRIPVKFSSVNCCELCFLHGPEGKVRYRSDVYGWTQKTKKDFTLKPKCILCTSCWNKIKALIKRKDQIEEICYLNNQLRKAIDEKRKL